MIGKLFLMSIALVSFTTAFDIETIRNGLSGIKNKQRFQPSQCIGEQFAVNNRGCSWFWVCTEDGATQGRCPEGLHFNVADQNCDYKDRANCQLNDPNIPKTCPEGPGIHIIPHELTCSKYTGWLIEPRSFCYR